MQAFRSGFLFALIGASGQVNAQTPPHEYRFNLPRQDIGTSLGQFARTTGLQVGRASDLGEGRIQVNAIVGKYSADQALSLLLKDSGYWYRFLNERTVTVYRLPPAAAIGEAVSTPSNAKSSDAVEPATKRVRRRSYWAALIGSLGAAAAAQEPPAPEAPGALEEVVVTSRKTEEKLGEIPVSITAFTAEDLFRRNVRDLTDIAQYTSGFSFENYAGGTSPAPVIRGLTQNALNDRDQNVGTFVDGVHVQQQGNIDFSLLDVERVEIVKGPQNAQYGKSSFAGAINWVPRKPALGRWEGYVLGTVGTDERRDLQASVSVPLWTDKLAVRVAAVRTEFDGTFKNNFPGSTRAVRTTVSGYGFSGTDGKLGGFDNEALQGSLRFRPIDELNVEVMYFRSKMVNEAGAGLTVQPRAAGQVPALGASNPLNCSPRIGTGINQLWCGELKLSESEVLADPRMSGSHTHSDLLTGRIEYQITDGLVATYVYGRGLYDARSYVPTQNQPELLLFGDATARQPGTGAPSLRFAGAPVTDQKSASHELRVDGKAGTSSWRLGYFQSDVSDFGNFTFVGSRLPLSLDPTGAVEFGSLPFDFLLSRFKDRTEAIFGSVVLPFADQWTVEAEGRYARETRKQAPLNVSAEFSSFMPRVNLKWQPRAGWMFYASAARGEKAGGFNARTADEPRFQPEQNTTFELGGKQALFDGRLQVNYSVFLVDWDDLQLSIPDTVPTPPSTQDPNFIGNVLGATSKGLEIDAVWIPVERLRVNLSASHVKSTFKSGVIDTTFGRNCETSSATPACVFLPRSASRPFGGAAIGGNDLPRTPRTKVSLGAEYSWKIRDYPLAVRADANYQSDYYIENLNLAFLPERTLLNVNATLTSPDGDWSASLWARNLTDEVFGSSAFAVATGNQYGPALGPGRSSGFTVRYQF